MSELQDPILLAIHLFDCVLQVFRRPRVAVLSTGNEVVDPETTDLQPGQIRDANRSMLLAAAASAGAAAVDLGIARDTAGKPLPARLALPDESSTQRLLCNQSDS